MLPLIAYLAGGSGSLVDTNNDPLPQSELRFGATLALADLDGDNRVDSAELGGAGRNRTIQLRLSGSGRSPVLKFDAAGLDRGSIFAQDVNDDGSIDLIWTDLVHPESVIIWLNDGLGRFERAAAGQDAGRFVIGASGVGQISRPNRETALGSSAGSFRDMVFIAQARWQRWLESQYCGRTSEAFASTGVVLLPADRAPPNS